LTTKNSSSQSFHVTYSYFIELTRSKQIYRKKKKKKWKQLSKVEKKTVGEEAFFNTACIATVQKGKQYVFYVEIYCTMYSATFLGKAFVLK